MMFAKLIEPQELSWIVIQLQLYGRFRGALFQATFCTLEYYRTPLLKVNNLVEG